MPWTVFLIHGFDTAQFKLWAGKKSLFYLLIKYICTEGARLFSKTVLVCLTFLSGKNDEIFPADGAYPYKKDLKELEFHLLDTGHFALEEEGDAIASYIDRFLNRYL